MKVIGERTETHPYTEDDLPRPEDAYGISKWEAEQALRRGAAETGLEVVVLRPPLVYGPSVKGNFLRLMNLVSRGVPLPLASVHNRRSLIYIMNLADAAAASLTHARAAGRTYLVSDGEDVSTPDLIRALAAALGVSARLLPCPVALLRAAALAEAVLTLYRMPEGERHAMGERGRRYFEERFERGRLIAQLERWMGGLAGNRVAG